jgi:hypothetical protein
VGIKEIILFTGLRVLLLRSHMKTTQNMTMTTTIMSMSMNTTITMIMTIITIMIMIMDMVSLDVGTLLWHDLTDMVVSNS